MKTVVLVKMKMIFTILLLLISGVDSKIPPKEPDIRETMVKILFSCFADNLKLIITTPNLSQTISEASWDSGPIPMIMINKNFEVDNVQRLFMHLPTFVFAPSSTESFESTLQTVKSSPWWHIDALSFVIGNVRDGCEPAAKFLNQIWKMNLLSSWFLCYEQDKGLMLYTYNPYTNRAPYPWEEIREFDRPNDRWTLYAQPYQEGREHCASLNFDKTKYMDGYRIKAVVEAKPGAKWTNKDYSLDSLKEKHAFNSAFTLMQLLFATMNTTPIVNYDYPGYFHEGIPKGFLQKLKNGSYDISLSGRFLNHNVSSIYPFLQSAPRILTQQRDFLSPIEKILAFYSIEIRYLTSIVLLITFIFILVIYKKREFAFAAFDVLRLFLSTGVFVPFNRTATRIFSIGIFYLIIILNATFQGNISAFLTKPERSYVDNMEDLLRYRYNVCAEYVVNDSSVACIESQQLMLGTAFKENLHISRSTLAPKYGVIWCRDDWPLQKIVEYYISRLIEAGIYEYFHYHHANIPLAKLKSREEQETSAKFRPIGLGDLAFAFKFLAVGLGISTTVFAIEMFSWKPLSRKVKKMKNTPLYKKFCSSQKFMEDIAVEMVNRKVNEIERGEVSEEKSLLELYLKNPNLDMKDVIGMACDMLLHFHEK